MKAGAWDPGLAEAAAYTGAMAYDELRQDYDGAPLIEGECESDPTSQFRGWFDAAVSAGIDLANAMTLATVDATGMPQARIVLLKEFDEAGMVFFTNYESRKGTELAGSNKACLMFWWREKARQVRIEGIVHKVAAEVSDEYFSSRPRESNLAAIASAQSRVLESREALEQRMQEVDSGGELVRPTEWGGYRLVPTRFEFWQGRPDRTHDRLEYSQEEGASWEIRRLYP